MFDVQEIYPCLGLFSNVCVRSCLLLDFHLSSFMYSLTYDATESFAHAILFACAGHSLSENPTKPILRPFVKRRAKNISRAHTSGILASNSGCFTDLSA